MKDRRRLAYEAHLFAPPGRGAALQRAVAAGVGSIIAITGPLRQALIDKRDADPERSIVAHDGIRRGRFTDTAGSIARRGAEIGWAEEAFIVGYVGRLQMIGMDKGVGNLIEALADLEGAHLALVGGPADQAEALRGEWTKRGLPTRTLPVCRSGCAGYGFDLFECI